MPFCPTCRQEFRPEFTRCEECDQALVASLPDVPAEPPERLVCAYQTASPPDALLVRSVLEGNGIDTALENEHAATWVIGMPISAVPLRVSVREQDASEAGEIIRSLRSVPPPTVESRRSRTRWWLLGIALLAPTFMGRGDPVVAASLAWGVLALGVLFYLRDGSTALEFTGARMGLFVFLGGVVSFGGVILTDALLPPRGYNSEAGRHLLYTGPLEEAAKFLPVLLLFTLRSDWFHRRFTWVLAGFASGVGFGLTESLLKFQVYPHEGLVILMVSFLHPMLTAFVGCCAAGRMGIIGGSILGWLFASLVHGLWNALASGEASWVCVLLMPVAGWMYWVTIQKWSTELDSPATGNSEPN